MPAQVGKIGPPQVGRFRAPLTGSEISRQTKSQYSLGRRLRRVPGSRAFSEHPVKGRLNPLCRCLSRAALRPILEIFVTRIKPGSREPRALHRANRGVEDWDEWVTYFSRSNWIVLWSARLRCIDSSRTFVRNISRAIISTSAPESTPSMAWSRRLGTLVRAVDNVFELLPPESEEIPERDVVVDATISIQSRAERLRLPRQLGLDLGLRARCERH